ncbi:MAG: hypothetical protein PVF49_00880 [Anaerolineales bacterium]|jgi:hypothetical protein
MKPKWQQFQQQQQQLQQQRQRMAQGAEWMEQQKRAQQQAAQASPEARKEVDQRFSRVEQEAARLRQKHAAGKLSEDALAKKLGELMLQDADGTWWMVGTESGHWYRYDGTHWAPGVPPGGSAAGIGPMAGVKDSPADTEGKSKSIFDYIIPIFGGLIFFYVAYSISYDILLSNGSELADIEAFAIGAIAGLIVFIYANRD